MHLSMLWRLPVSPCHTVDEFIYGTVLSWLWPPCEHAAVDVVVAGIMVQETRLSTSLEMDKWWFLVHICFLTSLLAPLLWFLTAFDFPKHVSQLQPCQPSRWYCSSMEKHICQRLFLSHGCFLSSGLTFSVNPLFHDPVEVHGETETMEMLWGVRYRHYDKGECGGGQVVAGIWNVPDILGSVILGDFCLYLNKNLSTILISDF